MKYIKGAALAVALMMANVGSADARNCTKGIPCGNSCISRNDTCHINGGSSTRDSGAVGRLFKRRAPARNDRQEESVRTESSSAEVTKHKVCKRGKPCGNTCIREDAVCRL